VYSLHHHNHAIFYCLCDIILVYNKHKYSAIILFLLLINNNFILRDAAEIAGRRADVVVSIVDLQYDYQSAA